MRRQLASDQGAIAIVVALSLTVIFGLAALAVDVGYWYDTRHQLQAAADAGALAGCSVLIETNDTGAADAAARDYAQRNANGAGVDLVVQDVAVNASSEPWSVKVVVARDAPGWFSSVIAGTSGHTVSADAKAVKAPLSGVRNLLPWGLPVLRDEDVDRIEVRVVSGKSTVSGPVVLSHVGTRSWSGAINAPTSAGGYDIQVVAYNVFGVPEWVGDSQDAQPASRVVVGSSAYPFASISVVDDYAPSDGSPAITVNVTTKQDESNVWLKVGNKNKQKMGGSGKSWYYTITNADISYADGYLETFPVDVFTGNNADGLVDAYVHIRRSSYPFKSVVSAPGVASSGGAVTVDVTLNEYNPTTLIPGQVYTLRVGSDSVETGNFGEVNFKKIEHNTGYNPAPCPPDPVGVPLGNNVKDWVDEGYGGGVHIGDIMPTSPGNSGWTKTHVQNRIEKYGNIIILPVVTKYEDKGGGSYDVIVRAFAAMRLLDFDPDKKKGFIKGEFLEYVATPSSYGGGGSGTAYAARLVNP